MWKSHGSPARRGPGEHSFQAAQLGATADEQWTDNPPPPTCIPSAQVGRSSTHIHQAGYDHSDRVRAAFGALPPRSSRSAHVNSRERRRGTVFPVPVVPIAPGRLVRVGWARQRIVGRRRLPGADL